MAFLFFIIVIYSISFSLKKPTPVSKQDDLMFGEDLWIKPDYLPHLYRRSWGNFFFAKTTNKLSRPNINQGKVKTLSPSHFSISTQRQSRKRTHSLSPFEKKKALSIITILKKKKTTNNPSF